MRMKNEKTLCLTVIVCLLPMLLGIAFYNQLPAQMPIHFTIGDIPDNYASKNFALFGIPFIMAVVQAVCMIATENKLKNVERPRIIKIMEWFIPVVTVFVYSIMVEFSLGGNVPVGKSTCFVLGILFMVIGNYLPKMSYEMAKGIFHPDPGNEKAFRKMVRIMGYSFIVFGLFLLVIMIWV